MRNALYEIDEAIFADANFIEAYLMRARICNKLSANEAVVEALLRARTIDSTFYPYIDYNLAGAYYACGRYVDAKYYYTIFLQ